MRNNQRGQSIVEISLITPLLLIALYIPVDFRISFLLGTSFRLRLVRVLDRQWSSEERKLFLNLFFGPAEANTVKTEVISPLPRLSDGQDSDGDIL